MTRGEFITHLIDQECYPDDLCDSTVAQLWHNAINGETCYVPYEDELSIITWGHIVNELAIKPPLAYDADYDIYVSFKEQYKQKFAEKKDK